MFSGSMQRAAVHGAALHCFVWEEERKSLVFRLITSIEQLRSLIIHNSSLLRLGAVVTVLSLALDPFAQQLIQTNPRSANVTFWTPTVARADRYTKGFSVSPSLDKQSFADADIPMKMAVLNGMMHMPGEVINQTSYSCTTGNCTWNPFESLAVCSSCNDLRGHLRRYSNFTALMIALDPDQSIAVLNNGTTLRTDNDLIINNAENITYIPPIEVDSVPGIIYMTTYGTGNASATASFQDNDLLIWSTSILRLQKIARPDLKWPDLPIEAIECALSYCIKQYNARVYNGIFYETEATVPNVRRSPGSWQVLPRFEGRAKDPFQFVNSTAAKSLEYSNRTEGIHWTDLMLESESGSKYNVSQRGVHGISAHFQNTFREEVDLSQSGLSGVVNGWTLSFNNLTQYSPTIMQTLWESPNISATFESLARSMSNAIRASEYNNLRDPNSDSAHKGVAQVVVTFYSIQWGWIVLPAALVLAGSIFLAITIWKTISLDIPAWKSHSLPPLAFSYQVDNLFAGAESIRDMEQRAGKHDVRFAADKDADDATLLTWLNDMNDSR